MFFLQNGHKIRLGRFLSALTLLSVFFFGSAAQARAYTDPGSGALIWQMLVAGVVGMAFYFRKFTSWFKGKKNETQAEEAGSESANGPESPGA